MKKRFITLLLTSISLLLCGCFKNAPEGWDDKTRKIFDDHLYGYKLPYIKEAEVEYEEEIDSVIVISQMDNETFELYVSKIEADGFVKQTGPYADSYILLKELVYQEKERTIDIDTYLNNGIMYAICYDPYLYSWPGEIIKTLFDEYFYIAPKLTVPSADADKYYVDTSYMEAKSELSIYCFNEINIENTYKTSILEAGFNCSETKNQDGYYVASDPQELVNIYFAYSLVNHTFDVHIVPFDGWPAFVVDYYTDQLTSNSGTRVPAVVGADSYEFIESSYDTHGYFFVSCPSKANLEGSYSNALLSNNYEVHNQQTNSAGNYFAISEKNDLLIQYKYIVVESPFGGEPYKELSVMFEDYRPHDNNKIANGLQVICPGTTTTLPAYPGFGERVSFSDSYIYLNITIQSATFDSVKEYTNILTNADWNVVTLNEAYYNYEAISPNRDIKLETSLIDGRIYLSLKAYHDPYSSWPSEGVQEIINTLNLTGEIPAFENALGFDYLNNEYHHEVICFVKTGKEDELIQAYNNKLKSLGWVALDDGQTVYYVKKGYTIRLNTYRESVGSGKVFISIEYGDDEIFDIDARGAFVNWKAANLIVNNVVIPGINLSEPVEDVTLYLDQGEKYLDSYLFELIIDIGEGNIDSSKEEIIAQFKDDNWEYSSTDEFYHKDTMFMNVYESEDKILLDICAPIAKIDVLTVIKQFVIDLGYSEFVNLPDEVAIKDDYSLTIDTYDVDYVDLSLYLDFESFNNASDAKTKLINAFKNVGWSVSSETTSTIYLLDELELIELVITLQRNSTQVLVQIQPSY